MKSNTPPPGIPPLIPDDKAIAEALGGAPIPPPDMKIRRTTDPAAAATQPATVQPPAEPAPATRVGRPNAPDTATTDPVTRLGGTFAPVDVLPPEAIAALDTTRKLLAGIVRTIAAASAAFPELEPILAKHKADLKKAHAFDLKEAEDFIKKATALIS